MHLLSVVQWTLFLVDIILLLLFSWNCFFSFGIIKGQLKFGIGIAHTVYLYIYIIQGERGIIGSRFLILFLASVVRSIIINFSQYTVPSHSTYCSSTWIYFYLSLLKGSRQESQRLIIDKIIRAGSGGRQRIKFLKSHGYENYSSSTE